MGENVSIAQLLTNSETGKEGGERRLSWPYTLGRERTMRRGVFPHPKEKRGLCAEVSFLTLGRIERTMRRGVFPLLREEKRSLRRGVFPLPREERRSLRRGVFLSLRTEGGLCAEVSFLSLRTERDLCAERYHSP